MRDRLEHDHELLRQLQRQRGPLARRQLDRIQHDFGEDIIDLLRQVDAGAPEDLSLIFPNRQRMWIVGCDPAYARVHREGHLDHLVEGRLVARAAQRAAVLVLAHGLERGICVEHAAAAGAEHVPGQVEQTDPRRMQEGGDDPFFVEPAFGGECEHVDAVERRVRAVAHQRLDGGDHLGVRRLAQHREQGLGFPELDLIHGPSLRENGAAERA
jgi:hypothetical protein